MPRKRQTQSGAPAQEISSVPGQRYGEGVEQQQMQQAMPAPDYQGEGVTNVSPQQAAQVAAPAPAPMDPAMIAEYLGANRPSLLSGTQDPDRPVTSGLSTGPGAGPEVLAQSSRTPLARYMQNLSNDTGNPRWKRLAERAGL